MTTYAHDYKVHQNVKVSLPGGKVVIGQVTQIEKEEVRVEYPLGNGKRASKWFELFQIEAIKVTA